MKPKYGVVFNLDIRKNNDCTLCSAREHTELRINDNNDPKSNLSDSYQIVIISLVVSLAWPNYSVFLVVASIAIPIFSLEFFHYDIKQFFLANSF